MAKTTFSTAEVARLSGLSPMMIDYLCRTGTLVPSYTRSPGRGRGRRYAFGDVVMLRALSHFLGSGISVAKLKTSLRRLRSKHRSITERSLPGRFLVTDGSTIYFKDEGTFEDLAAEGQLAFAFVVKLERLRNEIVAAIHSVVEGGR